MKCPECGADCERGMRLTFRLKGRVRDGWMVRYVCDTPGVDGAMNLPGQVDPPAEELTVFVEGV